MIRTKIYKTIVYAVLIAVGILFIIPFITMILNAFKPEGEILGYPPTFFPKAITLDNFTAVFNHSSINIFQALLNSLIVTVSRTTLILYLSALWGFALSKFKFRGRNVLFYMVLSAMMVPISVLLLPLYQEMVWMGLNGKLISLIIVVNGTTSYAVFIMKQFISSIPDDLIESAKIDGCSEFAIFHRIIFPLLRNAISAVSIIVFLYVWNDFLWPFMMIDDPANYTITVAMQFFNGKNYVKYGQLMAAVTISLLPIITVYFIFQNKFTQGISMTGLKE